MKDEPLTQEERMDDLLITVLLLSHAGEQATTGKLSELLGRPRWSIQDDVGRAKAEGLLLTTKGRYGGLKLP